MNFLKKLLGKKETVTDAASFWKWFATQQHLFFKIVKGRKNIETDFLDKLMPQLQALNTQFYALTGMYNEHTAELILTPEGDIKSIVFTEDLVAAAPAMNGWRFTALKPATGLDDTCIRMEGYTFDKTTITFYSTELEDYPDEIDITLVHTDLNKDNEELISNGVLIFLDNALGELNAVTLIDSVKVSGRVPADQTPIPVSKLKDFLLWREKEFIEKYKGIRRNTENDNYIALEATDQNGLPMVAILNQELLQWDAKASHPWIMTITITYKPVNNGMPDRDTSEVMNQFEDELQTELTDAAGHLNLGRETYNSTRTIYFACNEFRHVSRVTADHILRYNNQLSASYKIYKDKYWMTMNRFITGVEQE